MLEIIPKSEFTTAWNVSFLDIGDGIPHHCLFSKDRIHFMEIPPRYCKYELELEQGNIVKLMSKSIKDFFGTLITDKLSIDEDIHGIRISKDKNFVPGRHSIVILDNRRVLLYNWLTDKVVS